MTRGRGTGMLRFASEADAQAQLQGRRDRFAAGKIAIPERDIQAVGLQLLKAHKRVAWVVRQNAGAGYVLDPKTYRELVAAGHLKAGQARFMRFGFPGAGDATGQLIGGARLEVEFKSDRGVVSDDQQAVHEAVNSAGGKAFVARCGEDVLRELDGL